MNQHCPCIAINHNHQKGECDEPVSFSGYSVCATCRYFFSPDRPPKPLPKLKGKRK